MKLKYVSRREMIIVASHLIYPYRILVRAESDFILYRLYRFIDENDKNFVDCQYKVVYTKEME